MCIALALPFTYYDIHKVLVTSKHAFSLVPFAFFFRPDNAVSTTTTMRETEKKNYPKKLRDNTRQSVQRKKAKKNPQHKSATNGTKVWNKFFSSILSLPLTLCLSSQSYSYWMLEPNTRRNIRILHSVQKAIVCILSDTFCATYYSRSILGPFRIPNIYSSSRGVLHGM